MGAASTKAFAAPRIRNSLLGAFRAFIVRPVYKVAHRILAHEARIIRLEEIGNLRGVGYTGIKPAVVIFWA